MVFATEHEETFKVLDFFALTDLHVSSCFSCHNMDLVFYQIGLLLLFFFCIPTLPCHKTTDWLKHIKKEINDTIELSTQISFHLKCIPGDYLMKLAERMSRVCKAVIKVKGGYFDESQI